MNAPVLAYSFAPTPHTDFAELDVVRLASAMTTDEGVDVPAGTRGTIVAVWGDGAAYEVEVEDGLVTATTAQIISA